ncbi:hypothetical protein GCU60_01730 [Blastococcus saxobsidens]|uniref:Uncharacterized protein n=1 Tax=Blastococcus saxobsidens TaxID=138336 RepID=A0A6L9VXC6_9ACTN|nr:hypothetical protein [Blastococcus saxobsidens]NEK84486.1 hypothetical protein [Blastococcus saxobsidens]
MTVVIGLVLVLSAVVVAVLQAGWVARSARLPLQWWRVSQPLPTKQRYASDLTIAALVLAGAFTAEHGRPVWTFYVVGVGGAVVVAAAQAATVRLLRSRERATAATGS